MSFAHSVNGAVLALGYALLGSAATLRHIVLATVLQPNWTRVADSRHSFFWFTGAAIAASQLRWAVLGPAQPVDALSGLAVQLGLLMLVLERRNRSSALFFMCCAATAGVDLVAAAAMIIGFPANVGDLRAALTAWEVAAYLILRWEFLRLPAEMRASGYLRAGSHASTASTSRKGDL